MEKMKCPNCAGKLFLNKTRKIKQCPYCDSEFALDNKVAENDNSAQEALFLQLFDFRNRTSPNKEAMVSFRTARTMINNNVTVVDYLERIKKNTEENDDFAFSDRNKELMQKVMLRLHSQMTTSENVLLYKDSGVFSQAKSGLLITDENIYFLEKKRIRSLVLGEVHSVSFSSIGSNWYFNHEDAPWKNCLDSIVCDNVCVGMILALICTLVRDKNPTGYKIILKDI